MDLELHARPAVRRALEARDQGRFDDLVIAFVVAGLRSEDIERVATEELHRLPDSTREWWEGPCNCDGSLN